MQITTWNVNGLRAVFRKKADQFWWEEKPDVLCLQEIRAEPEQLTRSQLEKLAPLNPVWHPGKRSGYSGVATFHTRKPLDTIPGFGMEHFDREGRVVQTRFAGFRLFNVYFPNGQRGQERLDFKLEFYASLLDYCQGLRREWESIVICGDFNTAHRPIDLRNPKENEMNSGFLPEERAWIDRYLEAGYRDAYRELYPEREEYTWWTYRFNARARDIGWRLDYFLVSEDLLPRVKDVVIHKDVMGSDHCPVSLFIDIPG